MLVCLGEQLNSLMKREASSSATASVGLPDAPIVKKLFHNASNGVGTCSTVDPELKECLVQLIHQGGWKVRRDPDEPGRWIDQPDFIQFGVVFVPPFRIGYLYNLKGANNHGRVAAIRAFAFGNESASDPFWIPSFKGAPSLRAAIF
ncbi:MAG: hypothetical protein WD942_08745 [Dehalococcoidia bacterium]